MSRIVASKRKKKWMGTIAGTLSTSSPHFFRSGTSVFTEQGWWTLSYSKLTPNGIFQISGEVCFLYARRNTIDFVDTRLMLEKQKTKDGNKMMSDVERVQQILVEKGYYKEDELENIHVNSVDLMPEKNSFDSKISVSTAASSTF